MSFGELWAAHVRRRWDAINVCRCSNCQRHVLEHRGAEGWFLVWQDLEWYLAADEETAWARAIKIRREAIERSWSYVAKHT